MDSLTADFLHMIGALSETSHQVHKFARRLKDLPVNEALELLEALCEKMIQGDLKAREVLTPTLFVQVFLQHFEPTQKILYYQRAEELNTKFAKALFSDFSPQRFAPSPDPSRLPDPRAALPRPSQKGKPDPITLGERRALAKSRNPLVLEKMLLDPDPRVVKNLCDNPHLQEKQILRIASHQPMQAETLLILGCHPKWGLHSMVQSALIQNPYTPPILGVIFLFAADQKFLRQVATMETLHPLIQGLAKHLLERRKHFSRKI